MMEFKNQDETSRGHRQRNEALFKLSESMSLTFHQQRVRLQACRMKHAEVYIPKNLTFGRVIGTVAWSEVFNRIGRADGITITDVSKWRWTTGPFVETYPAHLLLGRRFRNSAGAEYMIGPMDNLSGKELLMIWDPKQRNRNAMNQVGRWSVEDINKNLSSGDWELLDD